MIRIVERFIVYVYISIIHYTLYAYTTHILLLLYHIAIVRSQD